MGENEEKQNDVLEDLVDITEITIKTNLPKEERILDYLKQIKNPYHFKVGEISVSVSFSPEGETLEEIIEDYRSTQSFTEK